MKNKKLQKKDFGGLKFENLEKFEKIWKKSIFGHFLTSDLSINFHVNGLYIKNERGMHIVLESEKSIFERVSKIGHCLGELRKYCFKNSDF